MPLLEIISGKPPELEETIAIPFNKGVQKADF